MGVWALFKTAVNTFSRIEGTQWAGAFAYYAFFALFPLILIAVTIAAIFIDQTQASSAVIAYIESFVPIGAETKETIFQTIRGVIASREKARGIALLLLIWVSMRAFTTLIFATNAAWGGEGYRWWRVPLKSLSLLCIMVSAGMLGMALPLLAGLAKQWLFPDHFITNWVFNLWNFLLPSLVLFLSLSLIYKLAPRQKVAFASVWPAALSASLLLQLSKSGFEFYLRNIAKFNALYGAFGSIMALLLWIYVSGNIFIFGACLSAAHSEALSQKGKLR